MDENRIPEFLCGYFNAGGLGMIFVPETWRESCASLWITGGGTEKTYVDGSRIMAVPFEIRIRCDGRTIADRLEAVSFFAAVSRYIDGGSADITVTSGASKSAVYDNGEEEYRGAYVLRYYQSK